jgi:hypothetical protein
MNKKMSNDKKICNIKYYKYVTPILNDPYKYYIIPMVKCYTCGKEHILTSFAQIYINNNRIKTCTECANLIFQDNEKNKIFIIKNVINTFTLERILEEEENDDDDN